MIFARGSFLDQFRCLTGFSIHLCMYLSLYMLLSLYGYFKFCLRHILTYSSFFQEHTHVYSELCVSLPNSEPWHIQTLRYIHNTMLNILTKTPSLTLDFWNNFTVSLTLHFRHIQAYSRLIQD